MLGREPRLSHAAMRWLIISLLLLNAVQIIVLQGAINSSALGHMAEAWTYVVISAAAFAACIVIIGIGFALARRR